MKVVVSRTWSAVLYPMSMVNLEVILNISPEVGKAAIVEWAKNKTSLLLLKSSPVVNIAFVLRFEVQAPPAMGHIAHNSLMRAENCSRHVDHSFRGIYRTLWDLRVAQRCACSQLQCTLAALSKEPHILFIFGPPICSKYS